MEGHAGPGWAAALEASGLGVLMRESAVLYPLANIAHILGLVLFAGSILLLDLRLLGSARSLPALAVARALTPLMLFGLAVQIASGVLLFSADARPGVPAEAVSNSGGWFGSVESSVIVKSTWLAPTASSPDIRASIRIDA